MRRIMDFLNILSAFFDLCACFEFLSRHVSVRLCGDSMVSHLSGFTLKADGNFELFFIFVLTTKLNLHQIIYLFERHYRYEESKVDREFLSWVGGRLGVYLRFVRWGRCQKSKECHLNCHRSWLFWTPLGDMRSCCDYCRWRNQMLVRITIFFSIYFFDCTEFNQLRWLRFSPFQIRAAHSFLTPGGSVQNIYRGEIGKLSSCSKRWSHLWNESLISNLKRFQFIMCLKDTMAI